MSLPPAPEAILDLVHWINFYTMVLTKCAKGGGGNNWFIFRNEIIIPTLEIQVLPRSFCKVEKIRGFGPPPT